MFINKKSPTHPQHPFRNFCAWPPPVAMGSPLGPVIANIFMAELEIELYTLHSWRQKVNKNLGGMGGTLWKIVLNHMGNSFSSNYPYQVDAT